MKQRGVFQHSPRARVSEAIKRQGQPQQLWVAVKSKAAYVAGVGAPPKHCLCKAYRAQ